MTSKELPILFKPEMHRAIRTGRKTMTRRILKPQPPNWVTVLGFTTFTPDSSISGRGNYLDCGPAEKFFKMRYRLGDRLYIKEAYADYTEARPCIRCGVVHPATHLDGCPYGPPVMYKMDFPDGVKGVKWRSPLFMPKSAARTWLEVTAVRAERLNDISEEDAKAEGVLPWEFDPQQPMTTGELGAERPYRGGFAVLWDDINEEYTWKSNPWVWVYTFKLL